VVASRVLRWLYEPIANERGLFGIRIRLPNPFRFIKKAIGVFGGIASVLPIPGGGLIGKAAQLINRGKGAVRQAEGIYRTLRSSANIVPAQAYAGVMPGGLRVGGSRRPTASGSPRKRAARARRAPIRAARRSKRKLKFGSPAWRARYMKRRR